MSSDVSAITLPRSTGTVTGDRTRLDDLNSECASSFVGEKGVLGDDVRSYTQTTIGATKEGTDFHLNDFLSQGGSDARDEGVTLSTTNALTSNIPSSAPLCTKGAKSKPYEAVGQATLIWDTPGKSRRPALILPRIPSATAVRLASLFNSMSSRNAMLTTEREAKAAVRETIEAWKNGKEVRKGRDEKLYEKQVEALKLLKRMSPEEAMNATKKFGK